jgi:hypothetical protein
MGSGRAAIAGLPASHELLLPKTGIERFPGLIGLAPVVTLMFFPELPFEIKEGPRQE